MSAIPSGPAVCPLPAATSISIIVSRMCAAFSAITCICFSLTDIGFSIQCLMYLFWIVRVNNCRAYDKPAGTCLYQLSRMRRNRAIYLYKELGKLCAQLGNKQQFVVMRVRRLALAANVINPHHLYVVIQIL